VFIRRSVPAPYDKPMRRLLIVAPAALLLAWAEIGAARADEDDNVRARAALEAGEIRPLKEIVSSVQRQCGGRVIEVELVQTSHGSQPAWHYRLRMLTPRGDVLGLDVNAATTEILGVKGKGASSACQ